MRRRPPPAPPESERYMLPGGVEVPERLRVCIVEDWCPPGEHPQCYRDGCSDPQCCEVAAHVRRQRARVEFVRDRGLDLREIWPALCAMTTGGRPRWRDPTDPRLVEGRARLADAHPCSAPSDEHESEEQVMVEEMVGVKLGVKLGVTGQQEPS